MSDTLILSASFGGYDTRLAGNVPQTPHVEDFYYDNPAVLNFRAPDEHPRMEAKRIKLLQVPIADCYRYVIWIDGSMRVCNERFALEATQACGDKPLAVWPHPLRNDAIDEALFSRAMHPDKYGTIVLEQADHYANDPGLPRPTGLWCGGVVVWNMRHPRTQELADHWWHECQVWSWQDQVSLP